MNHLEHALEQFSYQKSNTLDELIFLCIHDFKIPMKDAKERIEITENLLDNSCSISVDGEDVYRLFTRKSDNQISWTSEKC